MRFFLKSFAILIAAVSSSCITAQVSVSRHHTLNGDLKGKTYRFVNSKEQAQSMEFQTFKSLARPKIAKSGLVESSGENPDYSVLMIYGQTGQQTMQRYEPQFGMTSAGGTSYYQGRTPYGSYSGSVYNAPTFGHTGNVAVNYTEYGHRLLVIVKDRQWHTVYQGNAECSSERGSNSRMVPVLINALLGNFPGKSGSASDTVVPLDVRW
jgi:hypothetical protein